MRFLKIGWNRKDFAMSDLIGWIASDYLFVSLHKIHYWINITKIVCDRSDSGNEKWDLSKHESHLIMSIPMPSNFLKSGNGTPALHYCHVSLLPSCSLINVLSG